MSSYISFPDISPDIFSLTLFGITIAPKWYAMAYIAGILIGWRIAAMALRRPQLWDGAGPPMSREQFEELVTSIVLGVVLGGRLGYVVFYQPAYYLANPLEIPMIWQGGMAFHGGLLGVVGAVLLFWRKHNVPLWKTADLLAISAAPGLLLGRIANFINGELWGRPTLSSWGVAFPGSGQNCAAEILHPDGVCARFPSQLYEAGLEGLLLGAVLLWLAFGRRLLSRPGALTGVFFAGYGLARMVVEYFRQADAQFISADNPLGLVLQLGSSGLSMGQMLSLPMVAFGALVLWTALRRPARA